MSVCFLGLRSVLSVSVPDTAHVLALFPTLPQAGNGVLCDHRSQVPYTERKSVAHYRVLLASCLSCPLKEAVLKRKSGKTHSC